MAKSNQAWVENKPNLVIAEEVETQYNLETVEIRSLVDGKVRLTGTVTGMVYIWDKAGSTTKIDARDKDEILNKKRGRSCCGGNSGKSLFELV